MTWQYYFLELSCR